METQAWRMVDGWIPFVLIVEDDGEVERALW